LTFSPESLSVDESATIEIQDVFYFAGSSLLTLGSGEITPNSGAYRILTACVAGMGLFLLSLVGTCKFCTIHKTITIDVISTKSANAENRMTAQYMSLIDVFDDEFPFLQVSYWMTIQAMLYRVYPLLLTHSVGGESEDLVHQAADLDEKMTFLVWKLQGRVHADFFVLREVLKQFFRVEEMNGNGKIVSFHTSINVSETERQDFYNYLQANREIRRRRFAVYNYTKKYKLSK
jgi:hypothetical protein